MHTEYAGPSLEDWERHLNGVTGIGAVPITDDDRVRWAAIDIDNHGSEEDIPIGPVDEKIRGAKLPLMACRSKSGGVHVYLFLSQAVLASKVRTLMAKWAAVVGHPGVEIFPKQARLAPVTSGPSKGQKQLGNWINLPYLGADDTVRYAYRNGSKLTLAQFLDAAEKGRVDEKELDAMLIADHGDAPPCIQRLFGGGVASGVRNEALYNITIYFRKVDAESFEEKALEANNLVFNKPLAKPEAMRTITSAGRPDYKYRCHEEPIRSLCDKEACLKRKYGIRREDYDALAAMGGLPSFAELKKYLTDPPRWELKIDGVVVTNVLTEELLDWRGVRRIIAERLTKIVPMIKQQEWERMLQPLMEQAVMIEAPEEASLSGMMRARLLEFAQRTNLKSEGTDLKERAALLRGLPVVTMIEGEKQIVFRAQDLVQYLKRTKTEELKGANLWFAVKELGITNRVLRAGDKYAKPIRVWAVPVEVVIKGSDDAPEAVKFEPGL